LNCRLNQIAKVKTGVYCQTGGSVDAIYLQAADLEDNGAISAKLKPNLHITGNLRNRLLYTGDVLLMAKGVNNQAFAYNPKIYPVMVPSTAFLVLTKLDFSISAQYLAWLINQAPAQQYLKAQAKGSSPASITVKILGELEITVPPLGAQKTILKIHELRTREKQLKSDIEHLNEKILNHKLSKAIGL
jgi:restriction endonuclease S subunit